MQISITRQVEGGRVQEPETPRLARRKAFLFAGIITLLPFLLAFAVLETFLRIAKREVDLYVVTGRVAGPSPMREWAVLDAFSAYHARPGTTFGGKSVNRYGFMSTPEIPLAKPEGTIRIAFLGESSTAGTGVHLEDAETWPWKTIERLRQKTGRKIDFINAAAGGYTTFESYGCLWSRLRHFSPDVVVAYHGWNDMYYFGQVDDIVKWRTLPDGSWSFDALGRKVAGYAPSPLDPLLRWSQTLTRLRLRVSSHLGGEYGSPDNKPPAPDFDRRGLEVFRTNLKLMRQTSEVIGARLVVAKQATLMVAGASKEQRERCKYNYHGFDYDAHVAAYRGLYEVIDQEIPADSVVDVTPVSGRSELFHDHVHPTPRGTTEIARIMADSLVPIVQAKGTT